ncbi:OLC1v1007611C1 [Oldenlandia corymbosa var. corymbosa]|uniref:OLC1v1007611C1 n=1 Tax=Oldenlandia corymbosa var. corymbosa TaxID=529605 RepID=A0AAV1DMU3_OLDCO|nr:OLC1v1007611C1 [Oldenlandia corymbosa var. corymbosa]
MARKACVNLLTTLFLLILVWPPVTSSLYLRNYTRRPTTIDDLCGKLGTDEPAWPHKYSLYALNIIKLSDSDVAGIRDWLCRIDAPSSNKYLRRHPYAPRKCLKHHPCPINQAPNSTASNTAFVENCVAALFDTPWYSWLDRMKWKHLDCHHYFMSLSKMIKLYRNRGMCMAREILPSPLSRRPA